MEINVHATMGACGEYLNDKGEKVEVSVVIHPLKVQQNEVGDKIQIQEGCSLWQSCRNAGCYFSLASRLRPQEARD